MGQFTVVTLNCLGLPVPIPGLRRRLQTLGRTLAATSADVVCLQEVGQWRHLPLLRHDEASWPQLAVVDYPYAPKGGLVTLARQRILDHNYFPFLERGTAVGIHTPERLQGKGVLETHFELDGYSIVVLNTHLAANYSARWSYTNPYAKVERAQLREIAAIVERTPDDKLVVVAGDFNVPRGSWLYHEFLQTTGLEDPLGSSREPTYRPLPGLPTRAVQALDHILIRPPAGATITAQSELCFGEQVLLTRGMKGYLSDHLGIRLTLQWYEAPDDHLA